MLWIAILGGLRVMMGQHDRWESLFYYFRIEDQVPENHLSPEQQNSVYRTRFIEKRIYFSTREKQAVSTEPTQRREPPLAPQIDE